MNSKIQKILVEIKEAFGELYGERLEKITLFGSQARSNAGEGSDIDILIVLRDEVEPGREISATGPITSSISLKHDVVISCVFMTSVRFATEQSPLLLNIRREGVPV